MSNFINGTSVKKVTPSIDRIPIYQNKHSEHVERFIPIYKFSNDFQKMYNEGVIGKLYYDDGQVTALSLYNTTYIPSIKG